MEPSQEYAEEYSFRERLRFVIVGMLFGGTLMLLWHRWALPWWVGFAERADCVELWGVSGVAVAFYTLFVGFPLLLAFVAAIFASRRGVRILRDKQFPYQGEKVFHPTRIRRGTRAIVLGWAHLLAPLPFLFLAVWGAVQAASLSDVHQAKAVDPLPCDMCVQTQSPCKHIPQDETPTGIPKQATS